MVARQAMAGPSKRVFAQATKPLASPGSASNPVFCAPHTRHHSVPRTRSRSLPLPPPRTRAGSIGAYSGDDDGGPLRPRRDAVGCVKHWDDTFRRRVSKLSATTSRKLLANPDRDRALRDWGIYMRDRGLTHKLILPIGWETAIFRTEGVFCRRVGAPVREGNMLHGVNVMGWPAMCHSGVINPSTRPGRNQKIGMWGTKTRSTAEYYCAINGMLVLAGCAMMVVAEVAEPDDAFHSEGERQYVLLGEHRAGTATGFWVRLMREAEIRKSHTHAHFNHAWVPQDEAPIVESPGERVVRFQEDGDDAAVHLLLVATSKAPGFASAASPALPPLQNPSLAAAPLPPLQNPSLVASSNVGTAEPDTAQLRSLAAASFHAAASFLLKTRMGHPPGSASDAPMPPVDEDEPISSDDDEHLCDEDSETLAAAAVASDPEWLQSDAVRATPVPLLALRTHLQDEALRHFYALLLRDLRPPWTSGNFSQAMPGDDTVLRYTHPTFLYWGQCIALHLILGTVIMSHFKAEAETAGLALAGIVGRPLYACTALTRSGGT